jgi:hypothetical protein
MPSFVFSKTPPWEGISPVSNGRVRPEWIPELPQGREVKHPVTVMNSSGENSS